MFRPSIFLGGLAVLSLSTASCTHTEPTQDTCKQRRGAFDVGSSSTTMVIADVDTCSKRIIALVEVQDVEKKKTVLVRKIDYTSDLAEGKQNRFSKEIQDQGVAALKTLKAAGDEVGVQAWAGVATAIFREGANAQDVMKRFKDEVGVDIKVIPQKVEAEIGYLAGKSVIKEHHKKVIVWDIGSKSTQFTYQGADGSIDFFDGGIASTPFKQFIIVDLQKKPYSHNSSPNPISASDSKKAMAFAAKAAKRPALVKLRELIKSPDTEVVSIGGVLSKSVAKQVGSEVVSADAIKKELDRKVKAKLSDKDLQSAFADTQVSNLAMVAGFMDGAGIKSYQAADVNLSQGILLMASFYDSASKP